MPKRVAPNIERAQHSNCRSW